MNNLLQKNKLKNRYFVLRHGKSEANEKKIILSHPDDGIKGYGLVEEGKEQVRISLQKVLSDKLLNASTILYTSDFKRARETAEIAQYMLGSTQLHMTSKLRERYFGNWDKTHSGNYKKVWEEDKKNPLHKNNSVESTAEVLDRTTALVIELEEKYSEKNILLVSHGDPLQILQTAFENIAFHRQLPGLITAEVRELKFTQKKK